MPPLGPMPNEEIDVSNYEGMEKYRSYIRYLKEAQEAKNKPVWWKTYRKYVESADPNHGKKCKLGCQGYWLKFQSNNQVRIIRKRKEW